MEKDIKNSKMTLDKFAQITQLEFLSMDKKIEDIRENMATKDDLKFFAAKDDLKFFATKDDLKFFATKVDLEDMRVELKSDIQKGTVEVLRGVDKIVTRLDRREKEEAAHTQLHKRITDDLHSHDQRIKSLESKV